MKYFLLIVLVLVSGVAAAQQRALTDEGKVVILSSDGTWRYEQPSNDPGDQVAVNPQPMTKDPSLNFAVKSTRNKSVFWIDPTKWRFEKSADNAAKEYSFSFKNGDLFGMAVTEELEIDLNDLAEIALQNAKSAGPDSRVVKKEFRTLNGRKVLYMEIVGSIQGIKFKYLGHYFSGPSGTTQFLVFTAQNLVPKYEADIAKFLNGLAVAE